MSAQSVSLVAEISEGPLARLHGPKVTGSASRPLRGTTLNSRPQFGRNFPEPIHGVGAERVSDVCAAALSPNPACLSEHLEVMGDCRLGDGAAALGEVAGAHRGLRTQLAEDREPRRVGCGVKEEDVGVVHSQQLWGATSCA